jgi:N-acetylglutamate synthase-like GNAT family acetyltransferase
LRRYLLHLSEATIMSPNSTQPDAPQLRSAAPADLPAIERLLTASGLPLDGVREALASIVVAEAAGDIVGVAGLELCCDNALLRSVAVADAWRSHGIGRALVTRIIADAEARGIRALYLLTTTAERYFPSFGFRPIARDEAPDDVRATAEFRSACPASATVMTRQIAEVTASPLRR